MHRTFADARRALDRDETSCQTLVSSFLDTIAAENERLKAKLATAVKILDERLANRLEPGTDCSVDQQRLLARSHSGPIGAEQWKGLEHDLSKAAQIGVLTDTADPGWADTLPW